MDNWPEVTILICTYERKEELEKTVAALRENLDYPNLKWLICDDSSPSKFAVELSRTRPYKLSPLRVVHTAQNSGWGVNVNHGLSEVKSDYVFFIEDDYVLKKKLDLKIGMALLLSQPHIGMLRYRGTAGEHILFHQLDADITGIMPDYRDGMGLPGHLTFALLDSGSPSLYLYSHGAHLKRKSFHEFYGAYPEGMKLGETEESYAHTVKAKMKIPGAPCLAILPDWIVNWFDHIGHSYQLTEADKAISPGQPAETIIPEPPNVQ